MMKKILFPIIALLTLAACSKVTPADMPDEQAPVSFQVANYAQTKAGEPANGQYDTNTRFGTYSWYINDDGVTVKPWMINETVGFVPGKPGVWKTIVNPYYWPKTGSADFISYSPFAGENGVAPGATAQAGETQAAADTTNGTAPGGQDAATEGEDDAIVVPEPLITRVEAKNYTFEYPAYLVKSNAPDLMYGDWANVNRNVDQIKDGERDSGFKGVPTLFHHALAKISVDIRATFLEYVDNASKTTTTWEVTLQAAEIKNVKNTGSLKLTMDASQKWVKPTGEVWTPAEQGGVETIVLYALPEDEGNDGTQGTPATDNTQQPAEGQGAEAQDTPVPGQLLTTDFQEFLQPRFVLPQLFGDETTGVTLHLKFFIKTYRDTGNGPELYITEIYDKEFPIGSLTKTPFTAWKMNQFFKYQINIKPTAVVKPDNPDDPTDAELDFVPAVAGWEGVNAVSEIVL